MDADKKPGAGEQSAARPAQVPGDAESPPKGTEFPSAKKAPNRVDPTEHTPAGR
jgi:hypothetical protein